MCVTGKLLYGTFNLNPTTSEGQWYSAESPPMSEKPSAWWGLTELPCKSFQVMLNQPWPIPSGVEHSLLKVHGCWGWGLLGLRKQRRHTGLRKLKVTRSTEPSLRSEVMKAVNTCWVRWSLRGTGPTVCSFWVSSRVLGGFSTGSSCLWVICSSVSNPSQLLGSLSH